MRARAGRRIAVISAVLAIASALSGCQSTVEPGETVVPSSSPESDAPVASESYGPGEGRPVPTESAAPEESVAPAETPGPTTSSLIEVRIGDEDHSGLEWSVSCSGLDSSPTIIASATDEANADYVVVVIGSGTDALASFTFTRTADGESTRDRSGLTVNPGANQGNGSLRVEETTVVSTGRGISYDEATVNPEADTTYSVEFTCAD